MRETDWRGKEKEGEINKLGNKDRRKRCRKREMGVA